VNDEQTPPEETPETPPAPEPTPPEDTAPPEAPGASDTDREPEASRASASETDVSSEAQPEAEPSALEEQEQPAAADRPEPAAEESPVLREEAAEEVELPPRQRPEIPGADLIPDIPLAEDDEFLDAEARAAAEAEAEARAAREREEHEDVETRPIADAAIDLGAGARYTSTGTRKTSVARVILKPGSGTYAINGKPLDAYFPRETLRRVIRQPLESVGYDSRMDVVARMHGGGVAAQAEALRHGISRALIVADPHLRGELKRRGFLTRDPRVKERKKAGLKKARKRPQFSKR
jgi:small subunit ribosomal protein S9